MLTKYSELLDEKILQSGLTTVQLGEIAGVHRSYISKNRSGSNVFADVAAAERVFEALQLSAEEYRELLEAYMEVYCGDKQSRLNKTVLDFLRSFRGESSLQAGEYRIVEMPDSRVFYQKVDVYHMMQLILEKEASRAEGQIRVVMQPDNECLTEYLKQVFYTNAKCQVDQIICLEKLSRENQLKNLDTIKELIPLVLCQQRNSYMAHYYYDIQTSHLNAMSIFPYYIITSEYVMSISYDCELAVISEDSETVKLYEHIFDGMMRKCQVCFQYMEKEPDMLSYSVNRGVEQEHIYAMGNQPYIGFLDEGRLYQKYASEGKQAVAEKLIQKRMVQMQEYQEKKKEISSFFTKAGIHRMLYEGDFEELPGSLRRKGTRADALWILRRIVRLAEQGKYHPYLIDERKYRYPDNLIVCTDSVTGTNLFFCGKQESRRFYVYEKSVSALLYDFLKSFHQSIYIYQEKNTIQWLKCAIEEAEQEE